MKIENIKQKHNAARAGRGTLLMERQETARFFHWLAPERDTAARALLRRPLQETARQGAGVMKGPERMPSPGRC